MSIKITKEDCDKKRKVVLRYGRIVTLREYVDGHPYPVRLEENWLAYNTDGSYTDRGPSELDIIAFADEQQQPQTKDNPMPQEQKPRYKIGDRARVLSAEKIRRKLDEHHQIDGIYFANDMFGFCGKIGTIDSQSACAYGLIFNTDDSGIDWSFCAGMLEPAEEKQDFNIECEVEILLEFHAKACRLAEQVDKSPRNDAACKLYASAYHLVAEQRHKIIAAYEQKGNQ